MAFGAENRFGKMPITMCGPARPNHPLLIRHTACNVKTRILRVSWGKQRTHTFFLKFQWGSGNRRAVNAHLIPIEILKNVCGFLFLFQGYSQNLNFKGSDIRCAIAQGACVNKRPSPLNVLKYTHAHSCY
jgi:hypothetical protein